MSKDEIKIDINAYYKPTCLKNNKLIDKRFHKIPIFSNNQFKLKHPEFYSKDLLEIFYKNIHAAIDYLEGNNLTDTNKNYNISMTTTKRVAHALITGESMEKILRSLIGNKGQIGLELAVAEAKSYYSENKKIPICNEECMITIRNAILSNKYWNEFNVKSWNDFLVYTFGENQVKEWKEAEDLEKFNKGISELEEFYNQNKRLPLYNDDAVKWIASSVTAGIWIKYGVTTWNDLLMRIFGEVNLEHNLYNGVEGFNKAVNELLDFYDKNAKLPTIKECPAIAGAVYRGVWIKYGITKWNDIMIYTFGEVNLNIENDFSEKDSLEKAQKQLRDFKDKNGRYPTVKDGKMSSIWKAAKRGVWKDLGIESWNDLFKITFGIKAIERNIYIGKKGLERAIKEIRVYKKETGKNPSLPEMDAIYRVIKKGEWGKYGIVCWNDILQAAIGEVNVERKNYKGKIGFEKAIQELIAYKKRTGKIPTTKNEGMWRINYTIRQGEWKSFGVTNWYDLLKIAFEDLRIEKNKYKGKIGLDNAIQTLREFEKNSGRKPLSKDNEMKNIRNAISRGVWKEFDINFWNDLFRVAFGVENVRRSKYRGEKGLNRAAQELIEFKIQHNKNPTTKDPEMGAIYAAIYRGVWKTFDINTWMDLFNYAFKREN